MFGFIVKRLGVTMLVSKQEAQKTMLEHPDSIRESPCLSVDRETSFENDKRHFQFNDTGLITLTFRLLFSDQMNGSPITSSLGLERIFQGLQAEAQRSKQPRIACKVSSPPPDPIGPLY